MSKLSRLQIKIDSLSQDLKIKLNAIALTNIDKISKVVKWLYQYLEYLKNEFAFVNRKKYKVYRQGQILYLNFGFNVGNEYGGVHYAIVLSKKDVPQQSNIIVVPLTSKKTNKTYSTKNGFIDIGTLIKDLLKNKISILIAKQKATENSENDNHHIKYSKIISRANNQLQNMKSESIIKVSQIMTISKMRIINPICQNDTLENICIPKEKIQEIIDMLNVFI